MADPWLASAVQFVRNQWVFVALGMLPRWVHLCLVTTVGPIACIVREGAGTDLEQAVHNWPLVRVPNDIACETPRLNLTRRLGILSTSQLWISMIALGV
eukprot:468599-Amphidinium_carterae.2